MARHHPTTPHLNGDIPAPGPEPPDRAVAMPTSDGPAPAGASTGTASPAGAGPSGLNDRIGTARTGVAAAAGIMTVAGFVVWSLYSGQCGLGPLTISPEQLLVAGLPPVVIFGVVMAAVYLLARALHGLAAEASSWEPAHRGVLRRMGIAVYLITLVGLLLMLLDKGLPLPVGWRIGLTIGSMIAVSAGAPLAARLAWRERPFGFRYGWWDWTATAAYPILIGVVLSAIYVQVLFPAMPAEWGGARPRAAYLDVVRADLSAETLRAVSAASPIAHGVATVSRTGLLWVFFVDHDRLLVKPTLSWTDAGTCEIPRASVKSILWCGRDGH